MKIHKNYLLLVLVMKGLAVFIAAAIVDTIYSGFSEGSSIALLHLYLMLLPLPVLWSKRQTDQQIPWIWCYAFHLWMVLYYNSMIHGYWWFWTVCETVLVFFNFIYAVFSRDSFNLSCILNSNKEDLIFDIF